MTTDDKTKHDAAENCLFMSGEVFVELRPSAHDVRVPERFRTQERMVLQFGRDMPVAIPDLLVNAYAISGTLKFGGESHHCYVPWGAVCSLHNAKGLGYRFEPAVEAPPPKIVPNKLASSRGWIVFEGGRK